MCYKVEHVKCHKALHHSSFGKYTWVTMQHKLSCESKLHSFDKGCAAAFCAKNIQVVRRNLFLLENIAFNSSNLWIFFVTCKWKPKAPGGEKQDPKSLLLALSLLIWLESIKNYDLKIYVCFMHLFCVFRETWLISFLLF